MGSHFSVGLLLNRVNRTQDLVITTGLAVWYIILPHIHSGYQAYNGGLIHYYTIVSGRCEGSKYNNPQFIKSK